MSAHIHYARYTQHAALGLGDPNSEIGKQLCEKGRLYFDRSVLMGFMNKDYTWKKTKSLKMKMIAYWVVLFCQTMKVEKQWEWASKFWPEYKNLAQYYSEALNNDDLDNNDFVEIRRIFTPV